MVDSVSWKPVDMDLVEERRRGICGFSRSTYYKPKKFPSASIAILRAYGKSKLLKEIPSSVYYLLFFNLNLCLHENAHNLVKNRLTFESETAR